MPGFDGEELATLLGDAALARDAANVIGVAAHLGMSPRLAHQVAELFIERAIAWRVLARPEYALAIIAPHRTGLEAI